MPEGDSSAEGEADEEKVAKGEADEGKVAKGEADEEKVAKEAPTGEQSGGLWGIIVKAIAGIIIAVVGGIFGGWIKGCSDLAVQKEKSFAELRIEKTKVEAEIQLEREKFESSKKIERQKLDEELIKLALQAQELDKRREALGFMVDTNLIADPDIRNGVKSYLQAQKTPPFLLNPQYRALGSGQELVEGLADALTRETRSPDGKINAKTDPVGRAISIKGPNGTVRTFTFSRAPMSVNFSPDSTELLVTTLAPEVAIINVVTGARESFQPPWRPDSAQFSPDGKEVVLQNGDQTFRYDLRGNRLQP